jgi:uncharacterized protein YbcC (UPF0753/DUF2309 family)
MKQLEISNAIENASKIIGKTWPLYSFVTSNPLTGYEKMPFIDALKTAEKYLNVSVFPKAEIFKEALDAGEIDAKVLGDILLENQFSESPMFYINQLKKEHHKVLNSNHKLDIIMAKWLAAFMDEGLAEWQMPGKKNGFYTAWRKLAKYDNSLKIKTPIPKTSFEAISDALSAFRSEKYEEIFTQHLASLPGWTGYINHRVSSNSNWQKEYPIDLEQYLAVRLWIAKNKNIEILETKPASLADENQLPYIFLKAWEKSWQNKLVQTIINAPIATKNQEKPDAQLVFCIDTRSELIRRHVEAQGNYETFGYAGFFGIAMDYTNLEDGITRKSCPPILGSAYHVSEIAENSKKPEFKEFEKKNAISKFKEYFLKRMKNMLPSSFGFVEISGLFYGFSLVGRTLFSGFLYRSKTKRNTSFEKITSPHICSNHQNEIPLDEKVAIVKGAFDLTGWKNFAPLVVFAGHGSHTANNPFASSLDCGACAASPGRHNARMLAKLANLKEVREELSSKHNFKIPEDTIFIGAEHNTTTDAIEVFDATVPVSHQEKLQKLKENLLKAQKNATKERLGVEKSIDLATTKANDWGETRPEWGLAQNAGFIVAPRTLTSEINLHSRTFLHSYDWEKDITGKALEGIMQGPMVVTQWINNHYYFSTVDNQTFGGGSKITHNITGKFGVVQGNGGDLKMGLPLQSLFETDTKMYHQPLRLSVFINAPLPRIIDILERNNHLKTLLDNEWIYLLVMDPTENSKIKKYEKNMNWSLLSNKNKQPITKKNVEKKLELV